ncbi:hypothetical protein CVT24_002730 [Panaeolus cyanescens]|uniref:Uncharacterized protein n=1 Tax=Panaeolus cyanescens TaxID=181874 RepID=A0A409X7Y9_9AGAR|nr:hypothetical protein CVT24_002730 [Panaeolus cyanescens]
MLNDNPELKMAEMLNGTIQQLPRANGAEYFREIAIDHDNLPAFLWPANGFNPEDSDTLQGTLLRSPMLLRTFKHLFTTPGSALVSTLDASKVKAVRGLAQRHQMTTVTPSSIAYAAVMLRHAATAITDWRTQDREFDYDEFYCNIVDLFNKEKDDADLEWIESTIKWWNLRVFGREAPTYGDANDSEDDEATKKRRANSTLGAIKKARAEKRARLDIESAAASAASAAPLPTPAPSMGQPQNGNHANLNRLTTSLPTPSPSLHGSGSSPTAMYHQPHQPPLPSLGHIPQMTYGLGSSGSPSAVSPSHHEQRRPVPRRASQGGSASQIHQDENIDPLLLQHTHHSSQQHRNMPSFYNSLHPPPSSFQSLSASHNGGLSDQSFMHNSMLRPHQTQDSSQAEQNGQNRYLPQF